MNDTSIKIENQRICIYLFDTQTKIYNGRIYTATQHDTCPDGGTVVEPPKYDSEFEQVVYSPTTETWKIVKLDNPLEETIMCAKNEIANKIIILIEKDITIPIQDSGIYQLKYEEALRYIKKGAPKSLTNYPFLKAEANANNKPAEDCAIVIIEKHDAWVEKISKMETIRQNAKAKIRAVEINSSAKTKIEKISQGAVEKLYKL